MPSNLRPAPARTSARAHAPAHAPIVVDLAAADLVPVVPVPVYGVYDTFMQSVAGVPGDFADPRGAYVSYRTGASYQDAAARILAKALKGGGVTRRLRDERTSATAMAAVTKDLRP